MLSRVSSKLLFLCLFLYVAKIQNNSDMTKFILHFLENIFTSIIYYYSVIYNALFRFVALIRQLWQFSRCETSMFHDIPQRFCLISRNLYPYIFATCCYLVCYILCSFPAAICCVCESYSGEEKGRRQCFQSFRGRCWWCSARWILPSVAGGVLLMVGQTCSMTQQAAMLHNVSQVAKH